MLDCCLCCLNVEDAGPAAHYRVDKSMVGLGYEVAEKTLVDMQNFECKTVVAWAVK